METCNAGPSAAAPVEPGPEDAMPEDARHAPAPACKPNQRNAARIANELGYPVALKIASPQISHKRPLVINQYRIELRLVNRREIVGQGG